MSLCTTSPSTTNTALAQLIQAVWSLKTFGSLSQIYTAYQAQYPTDAVITSLSACLTWLTRGAKRGCFIKCPTTTDPLDPQYVYAFNPNMCLVNVANREFGIPAILNHYGPGSQQVHALGPLTPHWSSGQQFVWTKFCTPANTASNYDETVSGSAITSPTAFSHVPPPSVNACCGQDFTVNAIP